MLTVSTFFLDEFPPLRGLKQFFCIFLLVLHLSGSARKMEDKQKIQKNCFKPRSGGNSIFLMYGNITVTGMDSHACLLPISYACAMKLIFNAIVRKSSEMEGRGVG